MDVIDTKVLVACLFGLIRFLFGVLPIQIHKCLQDDDGVIIEKRHGLAKCCLALFQAFGGGVIFATCFLHMMPEVYESTIELKKHGLINSEYPFSQLIVSLGFFFVYFIEELAHYTISRIPDEPCHRPKTPNNHVAPETEDVCSIIDEFPSTPIKKHLEDEKAETKKENEINDGNMEKTAELETVEELNKLMETKSLSKQQWMRGILIVLALSLHGFFEGLAIGLQTSVGNIWYLFIAISIHSATVLFVVGLDLLLSKAKMKTIIVNVMILSLTSPIGIFLGLLITLKTDMHSTAKSLAMVFLEGLSTGTILYITFFEVLNREKERRVYRLRRASFIMLGFGLMACLECIDMYH